MEKTEAINYLKKQNDRYRDTIGKLTECINIFASEGYDENALQCLNDSKDIINGTEIVTRIQNTIYEVLGLRFDEYSQKLEDGKWDKKLEKFYARLLFVHHCSKNGISPKQYIDLYRTTILHDYPAKYRNEIKVNHKFKKIAENVELKINEML